MRRLFLVISVLVVLSLAGCAAAPSAVSTIANLGRSGAPAAQAQATPVAPATQGSDQAGTTTGQAAPPLAQNLPAGIVDIQNALSNLYSAVSPSVVNINVSMSLTGGEAALPGDHPELPEIPGLPSPFGDNGGFQGAALGSGFVWDRQGHIVTNNHVVENADRISVTFADGLTLPAELVGRDPQSEVAVIKVDPTKVETLRPVTVGDSTQVKPGQFVVAIGNPYGLEGTMTFGIVSALGRTLPVGNLLTGSGSYTIPDIIQTDAPVNPGNSGGVLVDMNGRLVGIPTAIESRSGASAGIGFAVPSVIVQKVVPELISSGKFEHPYVGIRGGTLTSQVAEAMKLAPTTRGALVVEVTEGGPAEWAGLRGSTETVQIDGLDAEIGGDVITAINNQPVRDFEDLTTYLARTGKVGDQVNLTILRNGAVQNVTVTLAARPAETETVETPRVQITPRTPETQPSPRAGSVYLGVTGQTLTPEIAQEMDLGDREGVLVVSVVPGSPAENAGLRGSDRAVTINGQQVMVGGDVITAVDGTAIGTVEELVAAVQAKQAGDEMVLTITRNGEQQTVTATLAARSAGGSTTPATPETQATPESQATPETQTTPEIQVTPGTGSSGRTGPAAGGPWLGVNGIALPAQMAQVLGLGEQGGVLLVNVVQGSPAERAGLKGAGVNFGQNSVVNADIVVAVDGESVASMDELSAAIQAKNAGDTVTLTIVRNGERQDLQVTLGARPAQ